MFVRANGPFFPKHGARYTVVGGWGCMSSFLWVDPFRLSQFISMYKFSIHYSHKISCLIMRIKQMVIHSNLSKMKNKIFATCLKGNNRDSSGKSSNTSYGVLGAGTVKTDHTEF